MWCTGNKYTSFPRQNTIGVGESCCEFVSFIISAIAVRVFKQYDSAECCWLSFFCRVWISAILDNIHPSIFIESESYRIDDHRLIGHRLDTQSLRQLKGI